VINVPASVPALIAAINLANAVGVPTTLNLAPGAIYTLTSVNDAGADGSNGLPVITDNGLIINGNGATIQRSSTSPVAFRILEIGGGTTVGINKLTIARV
jgi:hypothetical protein